MADEAAIQIKMYHGQRLYYPAVARYVTAEQLHAWIAQGINIVIHDAHTGEDVTRAVLSREKAEL